MLEKSNSHSQRHHTIFEIKALFQGTDGDTLADGVSKVALLMQEKVITIMNIRMRTCADILKHINIHGGIHRYMDIDAY